MMTIESNQESVVEVINLHESETIPSIILSKLDFFRAIFQYGNQALK